MVSCPLFGSTLLFLFPDFFFLLFLLPHLLYTFECLSTCELIPKIGGSYHELVIGSLSQVSITQVAIAHKLELWFLLTTGLNLGLLLFFLLFTVAIVRSLHLRLLFFVIVFRLIRVQSFLCTLLLLKLGLFPF